MKTFTPLQYLKIDIASSYGLDKEDWDARIQWFDDNEFSIRDLAVLLDNTNATFNPELTTRTRAIRNHPLVQTAESPALLVAGVSAWDQATKGKAISHPISLDATASGAQIMAILVGCESSSSLCNVLDTGHREDFYTRIYQAMQGLGATREDIKAAIMPWFYGSEAEPKAVFGEGEMLDLFYATMEQEAPGLVMLRNALIDSWDPKAESNSWTLPDNFHVHIKIMDTREEEVEFGGEIFKVSTKVNRPIEHNVSLAAHTIHSVDGFVVREISRRCTYDPEQLFRVIEVLTAPATYVPARRRPHDDLIEVLWDHYLRTGFLSARILDVVDAENLHLIGEAGVSALTNLISTLPEKPFPVLPVHDCFRVHPNYGNDLRRQYNQVLSELATSEILADMATQITHTPTTVTKLSDPVSFARKILDADYALS